MCIIAYSMLNEGTIGLRYRCIRYRILGAFRQRFCIKVKGANEHDRNHRNDEDLAGGSRAFPESCHLGSQISHNVLATRTKEQKFFKPTKQPDPRASLPRDRVRQVSTYLTSPCICVCVCAASFRLHLCMVHPTMGNTKEGTAGNGAISAAVLDLHQALQAGADEDLCQRANGPAGFSSRYSVHFPTFSRPSRFTRVSPASDALFTFPFHNSYFCM